MSELSPNGISGDNAARKDALEFIDKRLRNMSDEELHRVPDELLFNIARHLTVGEAADLARVSRLLLDKFERIEQQLFTLYLERDFMVKGLPPNISARSYYRAKLDSAGDMHYINIARINEDQQPIALRQMIFRVKKRENALRVAAEIFRTVMEYRIADEEEDERAERPNENPDLVVRLSLPISYVDGRGPIFERYVFRDTSARDLLQMILARANTT